MSKRGLFVYAAKVALYRTWWIPSLVVVLYLATWRWRAPDSSWPLFEVFLPLLVACYVAPAWVGEKEQGTWPLLLSYPASRWWVFASKALLPLTMGLVLTGAAGMAAALLGLPVSTQSVMYALPGLLFLSGLAVLSSLLANVLMAAWLWPVGWWAVDFITRGRFTRSFYLFAVSYPEEGIGVLESKVVLLLAGLTLWSLAAGLFVKHSRV